jgi:hypothetical protein
VPYLQPLDFQLLRMHIKTNFQKNIKTVSLKSTRLNTNNDNNGQTVTIADKTILQALALINECNKYKMDLTTNGIVITDAIKLFKQTKRSRLSLKKLITVKNLQSHYDEDKDQLEESQEEEIREKETTNITF